MVQVLIVFNDLFHFSVGFIDVLRVAGQGHPAERADAAAEQRADIGGYKTGESKRVVNAHLLGHLANVIPVVKRRHAHVVESQHRLNVVSH